MQRLGEEARLKPRRGRPVARALAVMAAMAGAGMAPPSPARAAAPPADVVAVARPAPEAPTQSVVVVGSSPLPGLQGPLSQVPANVQRIDTDPATLRASPTLAGVLDRELGAATVNDTAGSPWQLDLQFRGFTASPALGTPQGLSVFVDGVRVNEAFGDVVNWDLIPRGAIAHLLVVPGTDPVYGLNTLGGAVAVSTRDGFDERGAEAGVSAGSWGRRTVSADGAWHDAHAALFVSGESSRERGWALHDPSRVDQAFAKLGGRDGPWTASLALTGVRSRMEGSQTLPLSWSDTPRESYTWPDRQQNQLAMATAHLAWRLDAGRVVEATLYQRRVLSHGVNSNVSDDYDPTQAPGPDNPATTNAFDDTDQSRHGLSLQLASGADAADGRASPSHRWAVGATVDAGVVRFRQSGQPSGTSRDTTSTAPLTLETSLHAREVQGGLYVTDTWSPRAGLALTGAARYDVATVRLSDQLGTALDGHHVFRRLDPALGATWSPRADTTLFASVAEGLRAPTPVELSCADPAAPCSLPNAFVSDPALKPVVSRTVEAGARGEPAAGLRWNAAVFETLLRDDLQFVSSGGGASNAGYFRNVGRTRRRGLELGLDAREGPWTVGVHYAWVEATFRTPLVMNSPSNSSAGPVSCDTCTDILVRPGDRLPGVPRHTAKLRVARRFGEALTVGVRVVAQSSQYARGDEDNADVHGPVPGFARIDLDARWELGHGVVLGLQVENLAGRRYATFGALGRNVFTGPDRTFDASGATWRDEQFRSAGAPRGAWLSLDWSFGDGADAGR